MQSVSVTESCQSCRRANKEIEELLWNESFRSMKEQITADVNVVLHTVHEMRNMLDGQVNMPALIR